jgi:hypothetical protein
MAPVPVVGSGKSAGCPAQKEAVVMRVVGIAMRTFLAILMLLALISASALVTPASAAPSRACLTQAEAAKEYRGKLLKYRQIGSIRCWFAGQTPAKSEFRIVQRAPAPKAAYAAPKAAYASAAQHPRSAPIAADDLVGLAGTLCAGPCEDLRTVDPQVLAARLEAAHSAFIEYWLSFYDRWALR